MSGISYPSQNDTSTMVTTTIFNYFSIDYLLHKALAPRVSNTVEAI
jgi:hypothetical protein